MSKHADRGPVLESAARTDPGVRRKVNEDSVLAAEPFYLVADGLGGHDAGDVASQTAIGIFAEAAGRPATLSSIEYLIEQARRAVDRIADASSRGAGCTLTGVVSVEHEGQPFWYVLNIGDSRVYLHNGTELTQLTVDHSLRAELVQSGSADADAVPQNVITRALGAEDSRHDAWLLPVQTGGRLLICSDGLTNELTDDEILAVLTVGGRPASVVDELVRRACEAGGRDNVSVIVIDTLVGGDPLERTAGSSGLQRWDTTNVDTLSGDPLDRTLPGSRT